MKKRVLTATALLMSAFSLLASEKVEITGTYQLQVACHKTFHEEVSFVVEPGKDKFSGIKHVINLTADQKSKLRSGMKIKVSGKKQPAVRKTMTKGAVRKAMYKHLKDNIGMPLHCKGMDDIISKIAVKASVKAGAHDHGKLELKEAADDTDEVEVTIMGHVVVETVEVVK